MIRRHVSNEWWLIAQNDHALLAGELSRHIGGVIDPLEPAVIEAIGAHDRGWIEYDASPILNDRGQPMDVFETPLAQGLQIWRASSSRAMELGDYPGLLVSLHSLSLSAHATARALPSKPSTIAELRQQFEINKLQHAEIEQQETCRKKLGMRVDIPLTLGLAHESLDPAEQQLRYDFRWLSAMDQLSLDLCCTHAPFAALSQLTTHVAGSEMHVTVARTGLATLCVSPWPFAAPWIDVTVPFRRMADQPIMTRQAFLEAFAAAPVEEMQMRLDPPGPLAAAG